MFDRVVVVLLIVALATAGYMIERAAIAERLAVEIGYEKIKR